MCPKDVMIVSNVSDSVSALEWPLPLTTEMLALTKRFCIGPRAFKGWLVDYEVEMWRKAFLPPPRNLGVDPDSGSQSLASALNTQSQILQVATAQFPDPFKHKKRVWCTLTNGQRKGTAMYNYNIFK